MDKIPFREVVEMLSVQTLKDIAYSLEFPSQGNKQTIIDTIIDRINTPEEVIHILKADELKEICFQFRLKSGSKQDMIGTITDLVDVELFRRNKNWTPLEQLDPTVENILSKLSQCNLRKKYVETEKDAEVELEKFLMDYFPAVTTQYFLGGNMGLKIDMDIGNGRFGIEVKLSACFFKNSSEIFRMIGQAVYYTQIRYKENFLLVIVGDGNDAKEPLILEALNFMRGLEIKTVWMNLQ